MNQPQQVQPQATQPVASGDTPEVRYSRVLFLVAVGLLLLIPLLMAARDPQIFAHLSGLQTTLQTNAAQMLSGKISQTTTQRTTSTATIRSTRAYEALKINQSNKTLVMKPGEKIRVWVDFQNIGQQTWYKEAASEFIALNVKDPMGRTSVFRAADWDKEYTRYYYRPGRMSQSVVKPGETARFYITLQAPDQTGEYVENFGIVSEWKEWVTGGNYSLPISVKPNTAPVVLSARKGETMRVGVWNTSTKAEISSSGRFYIKDAAGKLLAVYHRGEIVTVNYLNGVYTLQAPNSVDPRGWNSTSATYVVFEPAAGQLIELVNYSSRPSWNTNLNDNYFRGKLEFRHSDLTNKTWVINTLPLEAYVRGVAEISNSTPAEMQKTMTIAERTYAEYHRRAYSKHAKDYFYVDNTYDQVYKGVGFEFRSPAVTQAVADTTGSIVTYDGKLAITPYFSRSDGKTRSFADVWGGSGQPWLVGVDVPWSVGQTMNGHGVGMDAYAGVKMASEGWTAANILKYFYTGTAVSAMY